jgi:hypothetical protein
MDKQLAEPRLETFHRGQAVTQCLSPMTVVQSVVCSLAIFVLFPSVSDAATTTTKTSSKTASTAATTTTKATASKETMSALERAIAAGKAASKRSLLSREKVTEAVAETSPTITSAPSPESIAFQKKISNLSQGNLPQDKLIEAPVITPSKKKTAAVTPQPEEPKPVKKAIAGRVTGINAQGLAVEYAQDQDSGGKEFWIDFDRKVKEAGGLKETSGLDVGDKVNAIYNEYPNRSKRLIQVKLLKKKPAEKEES